MKNYYTQLSMRLYKGHVKQYMFLQSQMLHRNFKTSSFESAEWFSVNSKRHYSIRITDTVR